MQQPVFISSFPGLFTAENVYRLPEGAAIKAENVVFTRNDIIEPRHGLPQWSISEVDSSNVETGTLFGVGPSISLIPTNVNTVTNRITVAGHHYVTNSPVSFISEGLTLPGGLSVGVTYYVIVVDANTISVSLTQGGGAVDLTSQGSDNFRIYSAESYKNIYYFKTLTSESYLATLADNNNNLKFVEILPPDYANAASVPTFRFLYSGMSVYQVENPNISNTPFFLPRYLQTTNGTYISTARGWQVVRRSAFPNTAIASADLPRVTITKAEFGSDADNNWFSTSNAVQFVATVVRSLDNNVEIESAPSSLFEVKNQTGVKRIVTLSLKSAANEKVRIYRTLQYTLPSIKITDAGAPETVDGQSPPVDYIQAVGDITLDGTGSGLVDILFNDDVLGAVGLPLLYTSASSLGAASANNNPPICADAVEFKGHAVYIDVLSQPVGKLELLSLGATTNPSTASLDGNQITFRGVTFTFDNRDYTVAYDPTSTTVPVEINPPPTLGDTSLPQYGEGFGFFSKELGYVAPGAGVYSDPIRVMMLAYDPTTNTGDAIPDAVSTSAGFVVGGGDITITIDPSKLNTKAFSTSGGFIYFSDVAGSTYSALVHYTTFSQPNNTTITFTDLTLAAGDTIADGTYATAINVWYIPGTGNPRNLPLYLGSGQIQATSSAGSDTFGVTDRPAYFTLLPPRSRPTLVLGLLRQPDTVPGGTITVSGTVSKFMQVNPQFVGATDRSLTELTDMTTQNLVRWINANATLSTIFFATMSSGFANTMLIRALDFGAVSVSVNSSSPSIGGKFEPPLTTTPQNLSGNYLARSKNGLMLSKLGFPELVPDVYALAPQPVGSSANRAIKGAATKDDLFIFKEREGVYRVSIQQGTVLFPDPILTEIVQLDTTAIPVASESVQVLDNLVYFLSDRGFCRIVDQRVQMISDPILQDVKTATARTPTFEGIRSYVDRAKHLYVCCFPFTDLSGTNTTFVFNSKTGLWSTSTVAFDAAVTDTVGRTTAITNDYLGDGTPTSTDQLNASSLDPRHVRVWQYLRQESFTGRDQENVYDQNFEQVVDLKGNPVTILSVTQNIVDSSFDQYDEKLVGFSTAVYSSGQITLTRSKSGFSYGPGEYFGEWINRLKEKTLYYKTTVNTQPETLIPVTFSGVVETSVTSTIVLTPVTTYDLINPSITDELLVGVNTTIDFVPFHLGTPDTLKQFSRYMAHYQDRPEPNSLPSRLSFSFAVDNQPNYSTPVLFNTQVASRTGYQTLVPLIASRGRYLSVRLQHSQPEEYFLLNGHSFVARQTNSSKVSLR